MRTVQKHTSTILNQFQKISAGTARRSIYPPKSNNCAFMITTSRPFLHRLHLRAREVVLRPIILFSSSSYLESAAHSRNPTIDLRHDAASFGCCFAGGVCDGTGWPLPPKKRMPDQIDGDLAVTSTHASLCSTTKTCRARSHRNGAPIRPYSSLYGHDLTNVDISGGGRQRWLSRGQR